MADTPGAGPSRRPRPKAADFLSDEEDEDMDEPMDVDPDPMDVDYDWNAPDVSSV